MFAIVMLVGRNAPGFASPLSTWLVIPMRKQPSCTLRVATFKLNIMSPRERTSHASMVAIAQPLRDVEDMYQKAIRHRLVDPLTNQPLPEPDGGASE